MSNRIEKVFAGLKQSKQAALIPYITFGDPDFETTYQSLISLSKAGADMIELGVPFNDPIADGPTIQKACTRALANSFSMHDIFAVMRRFRAAGFETPVVLMSYANPVFALGYDVFCREAVASGIDAALLTDLPPEEAGEYLAAAKSADLGTVFLCSPTTDPARLALIDASSSAYIYYVAHAGVTGARTSLPPEITGKLGQLMAKLKNKLCVGFGISTPEQAALLAPHADGLIVGSALVKLFEDYRGEDLQKNIYTFIKSMKEATSHDSRS